MIQIIQMTGGTLYDELWQSLQHSVKSMYLKFAN